MSTSIEAAGYVVFDEQVIWGAGATAEAAWKELSDAVGDILNDDEADAAEAQETEGAWGGDPIVRRSDFTLRPATAALLAEVEARGGAIAWGLVGGVACTVAEEDAT